MPDSAARVGPVAEMVTGPVGLPRGESGFSLVEVVASIALFAVVSASAGIALVTSTRIAESNENRIVAAGLATAQLEAARAVGDPSSLEAGASDVVRDGTPFHIVRQLQPVNGCSPEGTRTITVVVDWAGTGGPVHTDTVRAC